MPQTINEYPEIPVDPDHNIVHQDKGAADAPTEPWGRWKVSAHFDWLKAPGQDLLDQTAGDARYSLGTHDHDLVYSPSDHDHTGVYVPIAHEGAGGTAHADAVAGAPGVAGFITGADQLKLDGVQAGATDDQTGAEIKAAYEAEADTNAFTDSYKSQVDANTLKDNITHTGDVSDAAGVLTIVANAVGVAKMAQEGTVGQVLTSAGGAVDPSYQDLPGATVVDELTANATGTINVGNLCYFDTTWKLAKADAEATIKGILGIAKSSVTDGQSLVCVLTGDIATTGRTIGATQYVSPSVAGGYTETKPVDILLQRIIGYAESATLMRFRPSDEYEDIAGSGSGDVLVSGTPLVNQVAIWINANTIKGEAGFSYDGATFAVTGNITVTGTVDNVDVGALSSAFVAHDGAGDGAHSVAAGPSTDGFMTGEDKAILDAIEPGATADQTGAEIKSLYEAEANTNAFTDTYKSNVDSNNSKPASNITHSGDVSDASGVLTIAANAVTTTKINNEAVTLAKIAPDASTTKVLTAQGPGTPPAWAEPAGGSSADEHTANVASGTITAGDLCYLTTPGGVWEKADNTALASVKGLLGIAKTTETVGNPLVCTLTTNDFTTSGRTVGAVYYVGAAGVMTATLPTGANYTRIIGVALSATSLRFRPSDDYVKGA